MLEVCVIGIIYAKVVNDEGESYVTGAGVVEIVGVGALFVHVLGEEFVELGIDQNDGLGKVTHASMYLNYEKSVVSECDEVVLVDNFLGEHGDWNTNIFIFFHWRPQVKVLQVHRHIVGGGIVYGGVDM